MFVRGHLCSRMRSPLRLLSYVCSHMCSLHSSHMRALKKVSRTKKKVVSSIRSVSHKKERPTKKRVPPRQVFGGAIWDGEEMRMDSHLSFLEFLCVASITKERLKSSNPLPSLFPTPHVAPRLRGATFQSSRPRCSARAKPLRSARARAAPPDAT